MLDSGSIGLHFSYSPSPGLSPPTWPPLEPASPRSQAHSLALHTHTHTHTHTQRQLQKKLYKATHTGRKNTLSLTLTHTYIYANTEHMQTSCGFSLFIHFVTPPL